jgi:hypothetical protein
LGSNDNARDHFRVDVFGAAAGKGRSAAAEPGREEKRAAAGNNYIN